MLYQFYSQEFLQNLPLQLWMFGANHLQDRIHRPHGVAYFQWFYCVKGQGELILNNQRSVISKGDGFLIYPEIPHIYQGLSEDWKLHIVAFHGSLCFDILHMLQMGESGAYHFSDATIFETHIQNLLWLYENRSINRFLAYSKECYDFLLDISQCITHIHDLSYVQDNDLVLKIVTYLEKKYASDITLDQLALIVNLSKDYMCALFKSATGQTIINCLTSIRIGHARQLLIQYPEKKVLDIAKACGFESPSYFGKTFKRIVGMTPEQYRKNS